MVSWLFIKIGVGTTVDVGVKVGVDVVVGVGVLVTIGVEVDGVIVEEAVSVDVGSAEIKVIFATAGPVQAIPAL